MKTRQFLSILLLLASILVVQIDCQCAPGQFLNGTCQSCPVNEFVLVNNAT